MIVSFERTFIYVAIPRTATHAFRLALRPHLGKYDWEQCVLFEKKLFPVTQLARIGHGHVTAREIRTYVLPGFWDAAVRFCTVRNPFERFASACRFAYRHTTKMRTDPLGVMKKAIDDDLPRKHILFRPQSEFITGSQGEPLVNFICRYENLQDDFDRLSLRLAIASTELSVLNSSPASPVHDSCDDELEQMIRHAYRDDFHLLSYPVHLPREAGVCA